jgi:hypothetical protein
VSLSFHEELIKSVVDNGLLALIVLGAGVWLNWRLEKYKVDVAQHSEFMKLRMQAMNAVWSDIYAWMLDCDSYFPQMWANEPLEALKPPDADRYRRFIQKRTEELVRKLVTHRFFCGEAFMQDCLAFANSRQSWYREWGVGPYTAKTPPAPTPPWDSVESVEKKYLRPGMSN